MGIKITNLPTTAVNDADYIPVANTTNGTRKVLMEDVIEAIGGAASAGVTFTDAGNGNVVISVGESK